MSGPQDARGRSSVARIPMWPIWVVRALRSLRRSYTRKGVRMWLCRDVIDWQNNRRITGWKWLLSDPCAVWAQTFEGMGT